MVEVIHGEQVVRIASGLPCELVRESKILTITNMYKAAGLLTAVLLPVFMDYIPVFGPPGPPTAESAEAVLRTVKLDGGFYPPFVLEEMAQRPSAMEMIATLDGVVTGGAPLAEATGNRISEVTHLHCSFGHTEGSAPSQFLVDREDWAYFHFHPASGFKPEHLHGDLYKLVFHRAPEERNTQPLFHVFPDIDKFDTGDLISKHPSKPDLWLHRGRADDLVVLSTGEKFNPAPAEAKINTSTLVKRSLMAGNGRSHPLLLVQRNEATTANMTSEEITTALWPVVEETNLIMATQGRLLSDYVVILPENEEFSLSGKGSIQREASLTKFASYIESTSPPSMSQSSGVTIDTPEDAMKVVREILASVCGIHEAEDNDDLFGLGLDSAQAAQISGRLREAASLWPRELRMGIAEFYKEPTIRGLANRLLASAANGTSSKTIDDLMSDLVFKYTSGLEQQTRRPQRRAALTVALTGSTGNVGSHLLNRLVADPLVGKIICLNRAVTGEAAQRDAYVRHRLRQAPAGKKTVQYLCVDLAKPRLGLGSVEYETLQKGVDLVLHNAWELNFMRPVESFEKTHIAGVRHLIDLCTGSQHDARMVFISSIGAVNGRLHGETMITEEAPGPDHRPSDYGYSQAKSVSERILIEACNRGAVTGGIVRLGQIAGASGDGEGYWSTTDWLPRVLYTSKALGLLPRSLGSADVVDWVPVNAVPDILMEIVHTSADSSTNSDCQVHHIANPQRLSWEDLAPSVCQHLGEDIHLVEFQEWLNQLAKAAYEGKTDREKLPAMALLGWLEKGSDPELTSRHLSVKKTELVSPTLAGLEAVTSDMMQRWIREWEI